MQHRKRLFAVAALTAAALCSTVSATAPAASAAVDPNAIAECLTTHAISATSAADPTAPGFLADTPVAGCLGAR
ncbi:ABC-type glycerol-3-phosphate transport system substrate-binding protein [Nonomuraea thailandensis]|uniref:ABC-type glycerol-3-phosphate transport system substrate-binding protein n=1 Tax=Nonomuraea thailandensis TaxID=1188745 RepID=A0A9X2GL88_9ACTN|nr:hypothetical protein [Nonomuraea thailandensis]MCP2356278.1 ABC-type glycerol-3-phosphate transport system substrate-binding protein [Nonomuraea thailandensis]